MIQKAWPPMTSLTDPSLSALKFLCEVCCMISSPSGLPTETPSRRDSSSGGYYEMVSVSECFLFIDEYEKIGYTIKSWRFPDGAVGTRISFIPFINVPLMLSLHTFMLCVVEICRDGQSHLWEEFTSDLSSQLAICFPLSMLMSLRTNTFMYTLMSL